jgi:cytochrome c-type biogenesis protein CcmH/NrfG
VDRLSNPGFAEVDPALLQHRLYTDQHRIEKSPKDLKLWTLQGVALSDLHNESAAIASFPQAQKLSPRFLPAVEGEAQLEFKTHNPAARSTLGRVLAIQPENSVAHGMLGAVVIWLLESDSNLQPFG